MADLLNVKNLQVKVEEKEILHGVDLTVNRGETHVLMGPNGAGKSTLGNALMGNPQYQIVGGQILFNGQDITTEPTDQRAKLGMFLSFQNPLGAAAENRQAHPSLGLQEGDEEGDGGPRYGSELCRS